MDRFGSAIDAAEGAAHRQETTQRRYLVTSAALHVGMRLARSILNHRDMRVTEAESKTIAQSPTALRRTTELARA